MFLIVNIFLIINSSLCVLKISIHLYVFRLSLLSFPIFRTKWSKVLLAWLLMMVIYIFPEAGLVLFMSIYHWVRLIYYRTCIRLPTSVTICFKANILTSNKTSVAICFKILIDKESQIPNKLNDFLLNVFFWLSVFHLTVL